MSGGASRRLGMVYGGSLPEHRVLEDPRFKPRIASTVYLPDLPTADLADLDGVLVPEGTNHRRLLAAGENVLAYLGGGGTVLVFGDQPYPWLPGIDWEFRPALPSPVLRAPATEYGFHERVPLADAVWHHHGVLKAPPGADVLLATEDGAAVLYVDRASTPGTLLVSTLDPIRHCGETGMPAATRFLERFLPWVVNDLL